jgi:hypothetical protein
VDEEKLSELKQQVQKLESKWWEAVARIDELEARLTSISEMLEQRQR